jgi:hypothetical protein
MSLEKKEKNDKARDILKSRRELNWKKYVVFSKLDFEVKAWNLLGSHSPK